MKLLFVGPLWDGSTAKHRCDAFRSLAGVTTISVDSLDRPAKASVLDRIRHRLKLPKDKTQLNRRVLDAVSKHRPEFVFVDSSRVLSRSTIRNVKRDPGCVVAFYSPDDVSQSHNSSRQLESCDRLWDVFFTTKSFNVSELTARGVRKPVLIGNAYAPHVHRPYSREEVGSEHEVFDVVFVGTCENARLGSLNALAAKGFSVVAYGNGFDGRAMHHKISLRPPAYGEAYARALHTGKVALCFLRRLNRDRITTRSIEIPACGRPMIAEKTDEHDAHFLDGVEYVGFTDDEGLNVAVKALLVDTRARQNVADRGRMRCLAGKYSTDNRAAEMFGVLSAVRASNVL